MTPPREVKLGTLTTQSMLQQLRNQRAQTSASKPSNSQDKWNTSSWNDAKQAKAVLKNNNQSVNINTLAQVADAIGILNNFFGSVDSQSSSQATVASSNNPEVTPVRTGAGTSSVPASSMEQYSGYAQGISESSGLSSVNTSTLKSVSNAISNYGWSSTSLSNLKPDLAKESVKINQSLAQAQANFNQLQNQKMTAEANVTRLEGQVNGAKSETETSKTSLENNKSNLNSSVQARDALDEQLSAVNEEYQGACSEVKTQEKNKSSAQSEVSTAKSAVSKSQAAVNAATQSLDAAKSELSSTPETLEDGTPNPQYKAAKAAVSKAETEKQQAEKSLEEARKSQEAAEQKLDRVNEELNQAQQSKASIQKNLQKNESQYKELAGKCEKMQDTVEQNQQQYDQSLQTYDDTSSNYERLNAELEAQQGILTQYEAVETQLDALKSSAESVKELSKKLDERIEQVKQKEAGSDSISQEKKSEVESDILKNANSTEGCSASKTALENLIASKDYDVSKCTGNVWNENLCNTYGSAAEFERDGYIKNADGSFTDPRTGVTMVNVRGDDYEWLPAGSGFTPNGGGYSFDNIVGRDWSGAVDAAERSKSQQHITLNGFDQNGKPKFKWK